MRILLGLLRKRFAVIRVVGPSMEPAVKSGRAVIVQRCARPEVGDIVVVERPDLLTTPASWVSPPLSRRLKDTRWLVKRVVAGPGDSVPTEVRAAANTTVVPPGVVVLLGDNAEVSYDSRQAGFFPLDRVLGPVVSGCIPRGRGSVSRQP